MLSKVCVRNDKMIFLCTFLRVDHLKISSNTNLPPSPYDIPRIPVPIPIKNKGLIIDPNNAVTSLLYLNDDI